MFGGPVDRRAAMTLASIGIDKNLAPTESVRRGEGARASHHFQDVWFFGRIYCCHGCCPGFQSTSYIIDPSLLFAIRSEPARHVPSVAPGAAAGSGAPIGPLSVDVGVWALFWRAMILGFSELAVIPLPWIAPIFIRWFVERIHLPGGWRVGFVGKAEDIWWVFILYALCAVAGVAYSPLQLLAIPLQAFLALQRNRQKLGYACHHAARHMLRLADETNIHLFSTNQRGHRRTAAGSRLRCRAQGNAKTASIDGNNSSKNTS